jgi:hypothetical protein
MTAPAFGNSFNLVDPERNMPGSAVTGIPSTITYQQVKKEKFIKNVPVSVKKKSPRYRYSI